MKWSIGNKIASSFGLALAVLLVVGAASYDSTTKLSSSADWVQHTHQVLTDLDELLSAMKDGETGERGYVITGESRYLEPYNTARDMVDQKLKQLRDLTSDNPIQQLRLQALEPLVASKFTEIQAVIDLRKMKGFAAASQEILTDKGKTAMDAVRKLVSTMVSEETGLLD
jgi:methyl-accepting chemotaxis protein